MRRLFPTDSPTGPAELSTDDLAAAYAYAEDRPVRANFVASVDGAVTLDGRSGGLGTAGDRRVLTLLRDLCDVILVGAGTARTEGYGPPPTTAERSARRRRLGLSDIPRLALVSARLDLDPAAELFTAAEPALVITHAAAPADRLHALQAVTDVIVAGEETVDIGAALDALAERGLSRVDCEGGPLLASTVIEAGRLDELCLTISPLLAGGPAGRVLQLTETSRVSLGLLHILEEDGALFARYAIQR